jgi:hypothetical protein
MPLTYDPNPDPLSDDDNNPATPGDADEVDYAQKDWWVKRGDTRIITGVGLYAGLDENENVLPVEKPLVEATVLFGGFPVTGKWYNYENDGTINSISTGTFAASGNFAGFLYKVDSFIIKDNVANIVWNTYRNNDITDKRDELVEGDLSYRTYKTTAGMVDEQLRLDLEPTLMHDEMAERNPRITDLTNWTGYTERSRKYTYTFLGWSRTPQDWTGMPDKVTEDMLAGKYLTYDDWGLTKSGAAYAYLPKNNTQIVERGSMQYYAVYTRDLRTYAVKFHYMTASGGGNKYVLEMNDKGVYVEKMFKYGEVFDMSKLQQLTAAEKDLDIEDLRYVFTGWPVTENFVVTCDMTFEASYDIYPIFNRK